MKKIIFLFAFLVTFVYSPMAQPTYEPEPTTTVVADVPPDVIPVVVGTDTFLLPAKDVRVVIDTIKSFERENHGNWPTTALGWIGLVAAAILGGKFTQAFTSAKVVYNFLKPLLKNTLFIVALVAGGVSAAISYGLSYLSGGEFNYVQFSLIWSVCINIGVFIYEKWVKKPEADPAVPNEEAVA